MTAFGKIGIVGLGYVGLPLAVAFARKFEVVGFDVSQSRVQTLRQGVDFTNEISTEDLTASTLTVTSDAEDLRGCEIIIVTVPTPVDDSRRPDFSHLVDACGVIGRVISPGTIVVFESTVYPGATEEVCAPALEKASGLKSGEGFKLGYSPERINPGDKAHPLEKIVKVVSGQDEESLERLAALYGSIIEAGVHKASSIKVAEAAKVIENTQRDINIALMNEISKICDLVGIRSSEVLEAAGTKWNFLKFYPGLVGGHCIGVDPYYLTAKAEQLGYHPQVILAGRRINDGMGSYLAQRAVKMMATQGRSLAGARVGILGLTFKENVPDIRNSKVEDIYRELAEFGIVPHVHDPLADAGAARHEFGIELCELDRMAELDVLVYAVSHSFYSQLGADAIQAMVAPGGIVIDVRSALSPASLRPDISYWSL
ncbi:nucleotide sugar dehydrogenase [Novosphingobium cyanobacteriorum]|uniref:Nucleotide sugar dehydrogenase n=1 Tax=Novosphingobium cyanobacteriorum TaxID=3024215 RepID=A0ABT6CDU6_9SPHN|nr:nucleotide sugar dehydrogenase [Novosphingobium cyanobacteriorum]MDF8332094.1 nucleotide sugar dehydrogenase [Novosphingobium cyanobacteriorum]